MPRTRYIISTMLAVALLAAGCGGDDATEEPEGTQADGVSEVTTDGDRPATTTTSDSAAQPEPTDAAPQPVLVRLGDRFGWCADIQRTWDWLAEIQGQVDAVEAARVGRSGGARGSDRRPGQG